MGFITTNLRVFPTRAFLFAKEPVILAGATAITTTITGNQAFYTYWSQGTAAVNDSWAWSILLAAGTYTFNVMGYSYISRGKLDWYLDGSLIVNNQDWYSSTAVYNTLKTTANVVVTGNGVHTLKFIVATKNPSSSGYLVGLTWMEFRPATDTINTV